MRFTFSSLFFIVVTIAAPSPPHEVENRGVQPGCLKGFAVLLAPLGNDPDVLKYCSSKYPVAPVTSTVKSTAVTTIYSIDVLATTTTTTLTTTTSTVYQIPAPRARAAVPTPAPMNARGQAQVSAFLSKASVFASSICSCFQTPTTTTVTSVVTTSTALAVTTTTTTEVDTRSVATATTTVQATLNYACQTAFNCATNNFGSGECGSVGTCACVQLQDGGNPVCVDLTGVDFHCTSDRDCNAGQKCAINLCNGGGQYCVIVNNPVCGSYGPSPLRLRRGNEHLGGAFALTNLE